MEKRRITPDVSNWPVYPISKFDKNFPFFRRPSEIGSFSQDDSRIFSHDKHQLKYYQNLDHEKLKNINLKLNFDTYIAKDENKKDFVDDLLRWIDLNKTKFLIHDESKFISLNTDFVCWRGLLTRLLCTPYEKRDGWKIAVSSFNQTYYMCEFETDEKIAQRSHLTERDKLMMYGGFKFETYLISDDPHGEPDISRPVNTNSGFASVVRSRLDKHSLVFAGEVDCCHNEDSHHYLELKTTREMHNYKQKENFKRFKLIKWWAQSFLIGIDEIIAGMRNDDLFVQRLETFNTSDIPKMCESYWTAAICFNFCTDFLSLIKDVVKHSNPSVVTLFEWSPNHDITWETLPPDSNYNFLPKWYLNS